MLPATNYSLDNPLKYPYYVLIFMDQTTYNYTPLSKNFFHSVSSKKTIVFTSASSFLIALSLTGLVYLNRLTMNPQTVTTNASAMSCPSGFPTNPTAVKASTVVDNQIVDLKNNQKINAFQVTFDWEPVAGAKSYFVELTSNKNNLKKINPADTGKETNQSNYKFDNLRPNTTYYLLIRSRYPDNKLGFSLPNPNDCSDVVPAASLFSFTTIP